MLGNDADAEDAFQATFLVLLRRAHARQEGTALGSWLHGVAWRVAARARGRRRAASTLPTNLIASSCDVPPEAASGRELARLLHEELEHLPQRYQLPLTLCGLGGMSCDEAARMLHWPKSSLAYRLGRARIALRQRLERRGVMLSAAGLAAILGNDADGALPPGMLLRTAAVAAGRAAGTARVLALASGATRGTSAGRWTMLLLLAAGLSGGVAVLAGNGQAPPSTPQAAQSKTETAAPRRDSEGVVLPDGALARVGSTRLRHGYGIVNVAYSPDGRLLLTAGFGRLRLWDSRTGRLVREVVLGGATASTDGTFDPTGKTLLGFDGEAFRWFDVASGKQTRRLVIPIPEHVVKFCLAPHGQAVAMVTEKTLYVYDLASGRERFRLAGKGFWYPEASFAPDGRTLAAVEGLAVPGFPNPRIRILDTVAGELKGTIEARESWNSLRFSDDGNMLLGCAWKKSLVYVWKVPSGELVRRINSAVAAVVTGAFSPDGKAVAVSGHDLDAELVDLASGKETHRFRTYNGSIRLVFAPSGQALAVATNRGLVTQWDPTTGKRLEASADPAVPFEHVQFSPNGRELLGWAEGYRLVDWATNRVVKHWPQTVEGFGYTAAASPDGTLLVVDGWPGRAGGAVGVWESSSGRQVLALPKKDGVYWSFFAISPDGRTLYAAQFQGPLRVWDLTTSSELPPLCTEKRIFRSLVLSADGRMLAATDNPQGRGAPLDVLLWDLRTGREIRRLASKPAGTAFWELAISADAHWLAALDYRRFPTNITTVVLWDLRDGSEHPIAIPQGVLADRLALSPDGNLVATGGPDGCIRLWERVSCAQRHAFRAEEEAIHALAFSGDGRLLASTGGGAPAYVWDVTGNHGRPPSTKRFSTAEQNRLWDLLADADAAAAFKAMRQLMARPEPAVELLAARLRPATAVDTRVLRQRLRELDADDFETRKQAAAALTEAGEQVEPLLREALQASLSVEAKKQVEALLSALRGIPGPERLRQTRALEILEQVASFEAKAVLEHLASGAEKASLTNQSRESVARLKRRISIRR
jgi:RNA polymerase sigma factor (sigma-70 family)